MSINLKDLKFQTHKGETISGERLQTAQNAVTDFWRENALTIRKEDAYASHVTEHTKDILLRDQLAQSERIRHGTEPMGFWLWQRINNELTGECVPFFPDNKGRLVVVKKCRNAAEGK